MAPVVQITVDSICLWDGRNISPFPLPLQSPSLPSHLLPPIPISFNPDTSSHPHLPPHLSFTGQFRTRILYSIPPFSLFPNLPISARFAGGWGFDPLSKHSTPFAD